MTTLRERFTTSIGTVIIGLYLGRCEDIVEWITRKSLEAGLDMKSGSYHFLYVELPHIFPKNWGVGFLRRLLVGKQQPDIATAWKTLEKLVRLGYKIELESIPYPTATRWQVTLLRIGADDEMLCQQPGYEIVGPIANSAPLAIYQVALKVFENGK